MQANSPTYFCLNRDFIPFIPSVWNRALSRTWNCFQRNFFLLLIQHMTTSEHLCTRAKWLQSCPTLCDPMDYSLHASSVHGVLHARTLEWVAMPYFRGSPRPRDGTCVSYSSCISGRFFTSEPINGYSLVNLDICINPYY